ncbi:MAG: dihydroorotase [Chloroflexota bacterium]|nr:dihydroorotase [Chloroflexota bacterium]
MAAAATFGRLSDLLASLVVSDVRIIDPVRGTDQRRDLVVVDGRLAPEERPPDAGLRIDGRNLVAAPGLCDLHTHLREPGGAGEALGSGTRAAAHGGFTTVCAMPNTDPPLDDPLRLRGLLADSRDLAARVRAIAAASLGRRGEQLSDYRALAAAGAVGFSDDGSALASASLARAALVYLAPLGLPLIEHAEDPSLAGASQMRAGAVATRLGLAGWPPSTELTIVERDIALASETGGWVHFTHLSTASAVAAVRRAKQLGTRVTCDVTPHHLALTDRWVAGDRRFAWEVDGATADGSLECLGPQLAYDGSCRVNPPLPSRDDALALIEALADGTIDAIATDHAPHPPERTLVEFEAAAPGIIGLETALSIGLALVESGRLSLGRLLEALSAAPAAMIGEHRSLQPGDLADLVVFDPTARWRPTDATLASGSRNTPLLGRELPGVVRLTLAEGRITYADLP